MTQGLNVSLPGNPRYQPKSMVEVFGYDYLYRTLADVEFANIDVLHSIGVISDSEWQLLTPEVREQVRQIPTTLIDQIERNDTKHDVRAWMKAAAEYIAASIARWLHVPLTSYDGLEPARIMQFLQAHELLRRDIMQVVAIFADLVEENADQLQIGRTHGQHALPITVGFWMATILSRILYNWDMMEQRAKLLVGKISGAVGAHNAQIGVGFAARCGDISYEDRVLSELGLPCADISTQILPPEPLAYYLFSITMMAASFGQFGRDGRQLMRSEIGEIVEAFEAGQVGSSTMAHKRNPINFENLEGTWHKTRNAFGNVFDTLISEHQRDLVGSCIMRDFPVIPINLAQQLGTLLRKDKQGVEFLKKIKVNPEACRRNFTMSAGVILAEPLYICLQMAGYEKNAHELVNHTLMPIAGERNITLVEALEICAKNDAYVSECVDRIPPEMLSALAKPEQYLGDAREQALAVASRARATLQIYTA